MTFNDVKIPFMQYFLTDSDVNLKVKLFTKIRSKVVAVDTVSYIAGLRRTSDF